MGRDSNDGSSSERDVMDRLVEIPRPVGIPEGRLRLLGFRPTKIDFLVETTNLSVHEYSSATAIPFVLPSNRNIGAAYTMSGELIAQTQRAKSPPKWEASPLTLSFAARESAFTTSEVKHLAGRTFFAGRYPTHFGHILLETLTRFWANLDYPQYDHFIAIPSHGTPEDIDRQSAFGRLVRIAGLPLERFHVVSGPVVCENLTVADTPFRVAESADPRFLDVFDRMARRVTRRRYGGDLRHLPDRIYLSRSMLAARARAADKRSADNEVDVERSFAARGFEIIHPQELPIFKQIALARRARVIAGCDGSALHLALFARPGAKILALDTRVVPNQFLIERARGLDALHVWAPTHKVPNRKATWTMNLPPIHRALDILLDPLE